MSSSERKFVKLTKLGGYADYYVDVSKITAVYEKYIPSGYGRPGTTSTVLLLDNGTTEEVQGSVSVNIKLITGE